IRYADAMGAKISNNSWNGLADETDALLKAAIDAADTLFVGSAGNGNVYGEGIDTDLEPVSPNNIRSDKQITVAAIDPSGKLAPFSNYGSETVHLAAPGVAVYSAAPNGGYDYMDGTSMAAPHVAAAAAFVMGVRNLTVEETKELLLTASRPLPDLEGKIASGAMLSMLLPVSMVLPEAEVSLEDPAEFHNTAIEVKFRTTPFGALKAGEDTITIDLFGTAEPLDVSSPEVVSVNGVTLKAGDIMDDGSDGSAIVLRTPIGIAHDAPVVVRFSEAAGAINAVAGTYPHYVSTSVDRTSYDRTYTVVEDPTLPVVRFNNSGMPTKMPMNRTVTGVVYAELDNDAFTGTVGEAYGTNKFRVLQAPPGVSASAVKTSETTVSISVYGTDTTTIGSGQLLFMFDHGAFASGSYANVKNAIPQFYFWRYDQPAMNGIVIFTNNKFVESDWNDGSIQTWATAGLTFDTFAGTVGSLLTGDQVQFTGVPEGLTATARLLSKTIVQIELTGQAESHAVQDSTSGLTVTFTGAAYTSGLAAALPMNQLQVAFKDAPGKPAEVSAVQDGALVDLAWSAVADADRYVISAAEPEGRFFAVGETEENQYTDALLGFVPATIRYRIDAYRGNVVTHSEPVLVELEADHTYFEGVAALGGRPADGTKLTVRNADGSIRYQATFDAEDPKASVKEDHGIIQDGSELYIYFYAPNGTYTILLENGTWTSQRSVSPGTAWMLGEPITDVELRLYHVGDIGTMTLAAPQVADNPGGGGVFIPPAPPSGPPAEENANGEIVYKPSAVRETRDGVEVSVVTLTAEELAEALTGGTASGGRLVIEVDSEDAAEVRLPVGALAAADDVPVVEVRTGTASYRVPTSLLDPDALSAKFGVAPGAEWTVVVEMLPVTGPVEASLGATAADIGASLVGEPIDFAMRVETNGQTFDYNDFGSSYVERTIVADRGVNARTTTAARYDPESGSLSFVPATFRTEDGRTVVTVKRNGNSVYVLLESKRSFADLSGHWAKADVELLASKLVLNGTGPNAFSPDRHVTRAEFASMLTRALGLTPNAQAAGFTDVTDGAWYEGAVGAAVAYGLVTGFEDGTFRPNDRVTREQMAVMLERALTFAGGTASAAAGDAFADQADIGAWAV
ncbi:MAG TPA: S-layer homology domain-containing protein, partial [Paenibacillus sp.]|nr:S-layer homology domain-containing protein [Paenibacillus sp.]